MIINLPESIIPYLGKGLNPKTKKPELWLVEGAPKEVIKEFEEFQKAFSSEPTDKCSYRRLI